MSVNRLRRVKFRAQSQHPDAQTSGGSALRSVCAPTRWPVRPLLVSPEHDIRFVCLQGGLIQTLHIEYPAVGLLFLQAPKVYLASLAKMASAGFLDHLGLLVILVSLECKALQDLKVWSRGH